MARSFVVIVLFATAMAYAAAGEPAAAVAQQRFTMSVLADGPALHGDLSDPLWKLGVHLPAFVLSDGSAGGSEPAVKTEAYVLCDAEFIYVGFICHEPRIGDITISEAGRDGPLWREDCVELYLDPTRGRSWAYHWIVNSKGVIWDGLHAPAGLDMDFNADAQAASKVFEDRWTAEFKVPFADIGGAPVPGEVWGINLIRLRQAGKLEPFAWSLQDVTHADPQGFGEAVFGARETPVRVSVLSRGGACADLNEKGANRFVVQIENTGDAASKITCHVSVIEAPPDLVTRVVPAGRTETISVDYELPKQSELLLNYRVQVDGRDAYHSDFLAIQPAPEKESFRSWEIPDPLYEELLSDEPPGLRSQGSIMWQHMLDLAESRPAAVRFGSRYVAQEMFRDHSLSKFRLMAGDFKRRRGSDHWPLLIVPHAPLNAPDAPWVLDPRSLDNYSKWTAEILALPDTSHIWALFAGDEQGDHAAADGAMLMKRPGDYAYVHEADKMVRAEFGGNKFGIPKGNMSYDPNPYKWIAFYRWINHRMVQRQKRLYEMVQDAEPRIVVTTDNPPGGLYANEYSELGPYADVFTHQFGYPGGATHWRAGVGCLSKIFADLTGKEFWPCIHIENFNYPDSTPEETAEELGQIFRNGGTGFHLFQTHIGGHPKLVKDTRNTYFGSPGRYHTILNITRLTQTMPKLKFPDYDRTGIFYNDDTLATRPHDGPLDMVETIEACYTMLGPVARAWFKFFDCPQVVKWPSLRDRFDVIYLPLAKYQRVAVATKLRAFAAEGGSLVCGDPHGFETDVLGNDMRALRKTIFGVDVGELLAVKQLLPKDARWGEALTLRGKAAYRLNPGTGVEVLATYEDGSAAITAKRNGVGRAIFFGFNPFLLKAVPDPQWRNFFIAFTKSLGTPVDFDIWRFRFPDSVVWKEPALPGVCVTNNRVVWREEKLRFQNNVDVKGSYLYSLPPDRYADVAAGDDILFSEGRLTDRRKSMLAKKTEAKQYVPYEFPDSHWMVSWARPDPVSVVFDLRESRPLLQLALWFRDAMPAVTVEGSIGGEQWHPLGMATGLSLSSATGEVYSRPPHHEVTAGNAGDDVYDMVIPLDEDVSCRFVRVNFEARQQDQKLSLVEIEVWSVE